MLALDQRFDLAFSLDIATPDLYLDCRRCRLRTVYGCLIGIGSVFIDFTEQVEMLNPYYHCSQGRLLQGVYRILMQVGLMAAPPVPQNR